MISLYRNIFWLFTQSIQLHKEMNASARYLIKQHSPSLASVYVASLKSSHNQKLPNFHFAASKFLFDGDYNCFSVIELRVIFIFLLILIIFFVTFSSANKTPTTDMAYKFIYDQPSTSNFSNQNPFDGKNLYKRLHRLIENHCKCLYDPKDKNKIHSSHPIQRFRRPKESNGRKFSWN